MGGLGDGQPDCILPLYLLPFRAQISTQPICTLSVWYNINYLDFDFSLIFNIFIILILVIITFSIQPPGSVKTSYVLRKSAEALRPIKNLLFSSRSQWSSQYSYHFKLDQSNRLKVVNCLIQIENFSSQIYNMLRV